jgi:hypothetical protein
MTLGAERSIRCIEGEEKSGVCPRLTLSSYPQIRIPVHATLEVRTTPGCLEGWAEFQDLMDQVTQPSCRRLSLRYEVGGQMS